MDISGIQNELDTIVSNMVQDLDNLDETTKEYSVMVNNISKLQTIIISEKDSSLKEQRNTFDEDIRNRQLKLEKDKFKAEQFNKAADREIELTKITKQHEEKMAEIKLNTIKAENEKKILEQNAIKAEREFKLTRTREWLMFGGKLLMLGTIVGINLLMHRDELNFERKENGIVPKRCNGYDAIINKASEIVMK